MILTGKDEAVRLTGRWNKTEHGEAVTTAPGSMIEIAFAGKEAVLTFNMEYCQQPFPHLWITVDNGAKIETAVGHYIRIEANEYKEHYIKIVYKSGMEMLHRWHSPLEGKVHFTGVEVSEAGTLPEDSRRSIEFIGDSITEGVLIDAFRNPSRDSDQTNRVYQDDSTATYAYLTAEMLGLKPIIMGYGAVGITKPGCGGVPKAAESYPYCYENVPIEPENADITVINHGANDSQASASVYLGGYRELLDIVRSRNPRTQIVVLGAFCGYMADELAVMVEEYNKEKNENVVYISTKGWIPREPLHPLRDGHIIIAKRLADGIRALL